MKHILLAQPHFFKGIIRLKKFRLMILWVFFLIGITVNAQENNQEYKKVIHERSAKIVNLLGLKDSGSYHKVLGIISNQYFQLNAIQEHNKAVIAKIKKQAISNEDREKEIKSQEEKKSAELLQLHMTFIALLKEDLSHEQSEVVKDALTYGVMPITYTAYLDMIPTLTNEQKAKIYDWLVEARELAMDGESSEKKHAIFGKYKGRINNYLSAAGYDLKKEREAWEKRKKSGASTAR